MSNKRLPLFRLVAGAVCRNQTGAFAGAWPGCSPGTGQHGMCTAKDAPCNNAGDERKDQGYSSVKPASISTPSADQEDMRSLGHGRGVITRASRPERGQYDEAAQFGPSGDSSAIIGQAFHTVVKGPAMGGRSRVSGRGRRHSAATSSRGLVK